jgi:TolB-like protein
MQGTRFAFGPFLLDTEAGTLLRQGLPVPVGYRSLLLLTALVQQQGHVLAKATLMESAWPGTAVEEGNLSVQIASLRKLLGPAPDGSCWIATAPRVGYRFVGKAVQVGDSPVSTEASAPAPSIAVLPFANLSQDETQRYFVDGLAEDLITRLGRLRWLFVSARNSSFAYRGSTVDVRQVGRELGVRYVLSGNVRRSQNRIRVSTELSDAATGRQVWIERHEAELTDVFALEDQIAAAVIASIEPKLYQAEHTRYEPARPRTSTPGDS